MTVKERIRQMMKERGWTEYKLAKMAGISETTISYSFKRNNAPSLPTLEAICRAFGITMAQFFAEGGDPVVLTQEQQTILSKWSTLNETQQRILLELIDNI